MSCVRARGADVRSDLGEKRVLRLSLFPFPAGGFPFSLCPPRSYPASAGFIGTLRKVLGGFGRLWKALEGMGRLWEAFGCFGMLWKVGSLALAQWMLWKVLEALGVFERY